MKISDYVAGKLLELIEETDGDAEIKRNELAETLGCAPSQINYVLSSRFTPEQGYIVQSRRGGGGYIRIIRVKMDKNYAVMHTVNSIGSLLDFTSARLLISNLEYQDFISNEAAVLIVAAISDQSLASVPVQYRDELRASIVKNMLLIQI